MGNLVHVIAGALALVWALYANFAQANVDAVPPTCSVSLPGPEEDWLPQERWAWAEVCAGRVADLRRRGSPPPGNSADLAPRASADPAEHACTDARILRPVFLDSILFREPLASAVPRQGIRIAGACFREPLSLRGGIVHHGVGLTESELPALDFVNTRIEGDLALDGTAIADLLDLDGSRIDNALTVSSGARISRMSLYGAKIGGNVVMRGAVVMSILD